MVDVAYEIFLMAAVLLQIPLMIFYGKSLMIPSCTLAFWWFFLCMNYFISDILWSSPDVSSWWLGYGYCDLVLRLTCGAHIGLTCSIIAISRNLCRVLSISSPGIKFNSKKTKMIDAAICWVPTVLIMVTSYIVQYQRYTILKTYGCQYQAAGTKLTIIFVTIWTPIFSVVAAGYTITASLLFLKRTKHMNVIFEASNTGMTRSKYIRLLFYCVVVTISILSLSLYITIMQLKVLIYATDWFSWSAVHDPNIWSIIKKVTLDLPVFEVEKALMLVLSYLSFLSSGLTQEILAWYSRILDYCGITRTFVWLRSKLPTKKNLLQKKRAVKKAAAAAEGANSQFDSYSPSCAITDASYPSYSLFTVSRKDSKGRDVIVENQELKLPDTTKPARSRTTILQLLRPAHDSDSNDNGTEVSSPASAFGYYDSSIANRDYPEDKC